MRALLPHLSALLVFVALWHALFALDSGQAFASPFLGWMDAIQTTGLSKIFRVVEDKYGPNTFVMLFLATLLHDAGTPSYVAFKVVQFSFSIATYFAAYAVSRRPYLSLALVLLLATNSVIFSSIDIYFTPFLILALWALARRSYIVFSIFFMLSVLFKYQPVIFLPMVAADVGRTLWHEPRRAAALGAKLLLPVLASLVLVTLVFGPEWFGSFFSAVGTNTTTLSAYALNAQWLVSFLLEARDGSLLTQQYQTGLRGAPVLWVWLSRALLGLYWLWLAHQFLRRKAEPQALFGFLALTYLGYFILATNVQINHLHAAVIPLFLASVAYARWVGYLVYWGAMLSLNLLLAFVWAPARTTVLGPIDLSVLLALANCAALGLTARAAVKATR